MNKLRNWLASKLFNVQNYERKYKKFILAKVRKRGILGAVKMEFSKGFYCSIQTYYPKSTKSFDHFEYNKNEFDIMMSDFLKLKKHVKDY